MNYWQLFSYVSDQQIDFGFVQVRFYGIIMAISITVGLFVANKIATARKISSSEFEYIYIFTILFGIIGARIYHVIDYWSYYSQDILKVFYVWQGGLGIFGALLGGLLGLIVSSKYKKIQTFELLNIVTPGLLLAQGIGRWGNFFNREGFGSPTNHPWGIYIPRDLRPEIWQTFEFFHPVFLYESILCIVGFIFLYKTVNLPKYFHYTFGLYCLFYGMIRVLTESFRLDTAEINGFKIAHFLSVLLIIIGIISLHRQYKKMSVKIYQS